MQLTKKIKAEVRSLNHLNPNIVIFITYGLLFDIFQNMYKPFAVKFLERLGGVEFHIALYNALPGLGALVLIPGALLIAHCKSKKSVTTLFFILSRCSILAVAFVPLFQQHLRPMLFTLFIASMSLPEAVAQTSLQNFLGDIFDGRVRATAITLRNKFGNIAVPIVTLITGLIIWMLPRNDAERIAYYQMFYAVAFIVSVLEILTFASFKEQEKPACIPQKAGLKDVVSIMAEPSFRKYLLTTLVFQFTWQAGWPLTSIYQIKTLHANELWLAAFAVAAGLCSFFSAGLWSRLIYRRGNEFALVAAAFAMSLNMITIGLSPNLFIMLLAQAYSGIAVIGINSTLLNGLLGATPAKNRIIAIAVYNTFVNISLFISPFAANALLEYVGVVSSILLVGASRAVAAVVLLAAFLISRRAQTKGL